VFHVRGAPELVPPFREQITDSDTCKKKFLAALASANVLWRSTTEIMPTWGFYLVLTSCLCTFDLAHLLYG
jgi:hypothetical protein